MKRIAVLVSGGGTNLQALIDADSAILEQTGKTARISFLNTREETRSKTGIRITGQTAQKKNKMTIQAIPFKEIRRFYAAAIVPAFIAKAIKSEENSTAGTAILAFFSLCSSSSPVSQI